MQKLIFACLILAILGSTQTQITFPGKCQNDIPVQPDFDVNAYLGVFYEYAKYPIYFEKGGKCVQGSLKLGDNGTLIKNSSMINEKTNKGSFSIGYAIVAGNAKLKIVFPTSRPTNVTSNYWVLGTDYINYSVVYYCEDIDKDKYSGRAWILTRQRVPSRESIDTAKQVFLRNGLSLKELVVTYQTDC